MKNEIIEAMNNYNKVVAKLKMAGMFYGNEDIRLEQKEKFDDKLNKIASEVKEYVKYFQDNKVKITNEEYENGFNVQFRIARYGKYGY